MTISEAIREAAKIIKKWGNNITPLKEDSKEAEELTRKKEKENPLKGISFNISSPSSQ